MNMPIFRSVLYVPGNRPRMLAKAPNLPADAFVLDLEDSVPPEEKAEARRLVREALLSGAFASRTVLVRINGLASGLTQDDLAAVVVDGLFGVDVPKVETPEEVQEVEEMLAWAEGRAGLPRGTLRVGIGIESPAGLLRVEAIGRASRRLLSLGLGAEDFTFNLGTQRSPTGEELFFPKALVALVARALGVQALDTIYPDFRDPEGLIREAKLARQLGFGGKYAIHPDQLEPINRVFTPDEAELRWAKEVVEAYEAAQRSGLGSIAVGGRMVDRPIYERARRTLELAVRWGLTV
ncbi:MAG: CoA ester lyase [Chloroflexota bacterium]